MKQVSTPASGVPQIVVDLAWCKGCGICIATCPREALAATPSGAPFLQSPERCGGCLRCENCCPDFALRAEGGRR
jgi:2-oxoglutarate ferredoxin oxidoreductase subunit delta